MGGKGWRSVGDASGFEVDEEEAEKAVDAACVDVLGSTSHYRCDLLPPLRLFCPNLLSIFSTKFLHAYALFK
jgi:hypothetical protein